MLRSMFSAISGLRAHQVMMDVIGNNIANVNTVGFKSSRVSFQDILSQNFRGPVAPSGALDSINPAQIGLGVTVAGIDVIHTQGNLQSTGKLTDMAIQGDGFFVLANGTLQSYTRDGGFDVAVDGALVNPSSGLKVQGWTADSSGNVDTTAAVGNISIPIGQRTAAVPSSVSTIQGNLDAGAADGATASTTLTVYDSLGISHAVRLTFTKVAAATATNAWTWDATPDPADTSATIAAVGGTLNFTSTGLIDGTTPPTGTISLVLTNGADTPIDFDPAAGPPATLDFSKLTQFNGLSEPSAAANGSTSGSLVTFAVGNTGEITGVYSNGQTTRIGQIAMASFQNPAGLIRGGGNLFSSSSASGAAAIGSPGTGSRGLITTGSLEMSNVDLATQFTGMITAQRGFQANGRVITTSDEILQELVNLKR